VSVMADFSLEAHHERLLTLACEALDRAVEAREALADHGTYYRDRFDQPRAHPAVAVERDARLAFARLVRELDLDGEPLPDQRPPRRRG
jgi:phage terminase small subunit